MGKRMAIDEERDRAALMGPPSAVHLTVSESYDVAAEAELKRLHLENRALKTIIADLDRRVKMAHRALRHFPEARLLMRNYFPDAAEAG